MIAATFDIWRTTQIVVGLLVSILASGPSSPPPNLPGGDQVGCFKRPSSCGYPDQTNTGVPPGTELRPSGPLTITKDGTRLDGLLVRGTIDVSAANVTIVNSRIVQGSGGSGSYAIALNEGATNFTIKNSEVAGPTDDNEGIEAAVRNQYYNRGANAEGSYLHGCADCWEGPGSFRDDYIVVDGAFPGSHNENIYVCGASVKVDHSTLINRYNQTATVFGDTTDCGSNRFIVTDSLLAGGGFVLYPQGGSKSRTGTTKIRGNRFARCVTTGVYDKASGGTDCRAGGDSQGLYPQGGYYGVSAYYFGGKGQTWSENVWDDNLRGVCPNGSCHPGGRR